VDVEALVIDAFAQVGVDARPDRPYGGKDLRLDPDGVDVAIELTYYSLVTEDIANRLIRRPLPAGTALLVVADRVTQPSRTILTSHHGGYLDLRGRLALRTSRVVIDAEVERVTTRSERIDGLSGRAGLEVAAAILMRPNRPAAVRELARELGRSPSTVSAVLAAFRRDDVIDADGVVNGTDLFWLVAGRWPARRTHLAKAPGPGQKNLSQPLRLGLDNIEQPGWALTDSAAAVAYGAGLALRSGQVLDFFVPDRSILRRATTLLGVAESTVHARASVRVAPVPAVVSPRFDMSTNPFEWPLAHPLFVALDLAQDVGRGRAVLDAWTPDGRWPRVW